MISFNERIEFWTLPYYEGGVSVQNSILSLKEINGSYYYNSYAGLSLWNTPLGLSIGSSSTNPDSISSNSWFSGQYLSYSDSDTSKNGVIGMVHNLSDKSAGVVFLTNADTLRAGDKAEPTNKILQVPVGQSLLGQV